MFFRRVVRLDKLKDRDWKTEQDRVRFIVSIIGKKAAKLQMNAGTVSSDVLEIRKTFWEDVTVNLDEADDIAETAASIKQQAELLSERERTYRQMDKQLRILDRLKYSPYFGRIDFWEKGENSTERVYLGIASLMDETDENFLIYDWRAPISSLYYDFPPGPASYRTLEGTIEGELELKRQFIIRDSDIKGMFDTGVTIGDEMLQEVLGNNASTQMKSIVATIQREQNKIIRNEKNKYLIVQGVAGSGKTSAALQRVAYLLYRYRETLKSENIMLFSPNPLFNSYVATVLPELGEENMQQATFMEYLTHRLGNDFYIEDPFEQMEYLLREGEGDEYTARVQGIRFKGSQEFKKMIDLYTEGLEKEGILFKDLKFRGDILFSNKDIYEHFYALDKSYSMPNRIQMVKEWLLRELKRKAKQERTKSWVEEEIQFLDKDDYMEAFNKLQGKNHYTGQSFNDFEQEQRILAETVVKKKFKPLFSKVKKLKFIDLPGIYLQLFNKKDISESFKPTGWEKICKQTINKLNKKEIYYEDATPFVYLQNLIEGRSSSAAIRHLFIDEAQDYTPFQFAFIQRLFPYSKMTLLGDFNQAIFSGATGSDTILTDFEMEGEDVQRYVLTKTYRSTKEIVGFTSALIEGGEKIEPFNRSGKLPTVRKVGTTELNSLVNDKIKEFQGKGHKTIAVICRTAEESRSAYNALKNHNHLHLIEKGTISYEKGVLIIPSYLAKGIEFDAVILYDSSKYQKESERKLFYTVCTRAMHELHLFATSGLSPLMENVASKAFIFE